MSYIAKKNGKWVTMHLRNENLVGVILSISDVHDISKLESSLRSVLMQSYGNFYVYIVDYRTSKVRPLSVIYKPNTQIYKDTRIKLISVDYGILSNILNNIVDTSSAQYFSRLECGDIWQTNKIKTQLNTFKSDPTLGICEVGTALFDISGKRLDAKDAKCILHPRGYMWSRSYFNATKFTNVNDIDFDFINTSNLIFSRHRHNIQLCAMRIYNNTASIVSTHIPQCEPKLDIAIQKQDSTNTAPHIDVNISHEPQVIVDIVACKPKICLLYDTIGWAFYHKSNNIKLNLSHLYDITIIQYNELPKTHNFDIILAYTPANAMKHMSNPKLLCGVSSNTASHLAKVKSLNTVFTNSIYTFNMLSNPLKFYVPNGVDVKHYCGKPRSITNSNIITIGGVGSKSRAEWKGEGRIRSIHKQLNDHRIQNISKYINPKSSEREDSTGMYKYYTKLDIYIMSSVAENTPNPLLEAMAMGIPCIVNNTGMANELIINGENGYIISKYDDISGYVKYINKLISNPSLYEEMSIATLERIQEYSWEKMCLNYQNMFDSILKIER